MRVSLAAAGTAGHIEPALEVARWLTSEDPSLHCEFIGTSAALDSSLMKESGFRSYPVTKAPFPRSISRQLFLWPVRFLRSLKEISKIIKGSDLIIGFGGYVCAPTYILARVMGIPILIHEANTKPGMANNLGRKLGARLSIAFNSTKAHSPRWRSATHVGMPVNSMVKRLAGASGPDRQVIREAQAIKWGFDPKRPIVLIVGGSQGSQRLNSVIRDLLPQTVSAGIQIVHAVGKANTLPAESKNYWPIHYISDMAESMIACDFAITRGGAVTCTELGILRTFAVIIPLAIGNGEQTLNATELVEFGGALIIPEATLSARSLSENFISYLKQAEEFRKRGEFSDFPLDAEVALGSIALSILEHGRR